MARYVSSRLVAAVATIFVVSIVVFVLVRLLPGNPATAILGQHATPASVNEVDRVLGLDKPLVVQYWNWLFGALQGNFGTSLATVGASGQFSGSSVSSILAVGLSVTLPLAVLGIAFRVRRRKRTRRTSSLQARQLARLLHRWVQRARVRSS